MDILDIEIQGIIEDLPNLIQIAKENIGIARKKRNYQLSAAASGIALGYLIQVNAHKTKHLLKYYYNTTWCVLINLLKKDFCRPGIFCKLSKDSN